ncbi:MAG: glycosyltransferase family 4 protein [Acidobacteriota bacterium]
MHVLFVATKVPWPPVDGGRLLMWDTLRGLAAEGCAVTFVAPVAPSALADLDAVQSHLAPLCRSLLVPVEPRSRWRDALVAQATARPLTVVRHRHPEVVAKVADLVGRERFTAVHVEQVQALASAEPAFQRGVPVVMRAQNVESDLWRGMGSRRPWLAPLAALEGRRLAAYEAAAVRRCAATVALTAEDGARLGALAGGPTEPSVVPAPFAGHLPPGNSPLEGSPPVVVFGGAGWAPNRDGARWFVERVWPAVHRNVPGAVLHLFGFDAPGVPGVRLHPAPRRSDDALAAGSVLAVPLHVASGVRMKILEAWARGIPVAATPAAARGLDTVSGRELEIADSPEGFVRAVGALADPEHRGRMTEAARGRLLSDHDPTSVARRLLTIYGSAGASNMATVSSSPADTA